MKKQRGARKRGMTTGGAARRYFLSSPSPRTRSHPEDKNETVSPPPSCSNGVALCADDHLSPCDVTFIITQCQQPQSWKIKHLQVCVLCVCVLFHRHVGPWRFSAVSSTKSRHVPSFRNRKRFNWRMLSEEKKKHPRFVSEIRKLNWVRQWRCKCVSMLVSSHAGGTRRRLLVLLSLFLCENENLVFKSTIHTQSHGLYYCRPAGLVCADKTPQRTGTKKSRKKKRNHQKNPKSRTTR